MNETEEASSRYPERVIVNIATSPLVTTISLILYVIFFLCVDLSLGPFDLYGRGIPPVNPTVVNFNGFPVYASSQVYCV